ncbi:hypothetical protein [Hymenobacter lapidiphilus]|uniref:Uncharacterized protein n=1 Tax=Hymenobacter lapidiphilus TaxID=2608003 RepID=A0A7Y7U665_9BACT|nr:hypothetical protein [Hymenobacter lapidiphilus]NVO31185.1 hypothetical protein [Hymenobacter lapidiphilus]
MSYDKTVALLSRYSPKEVRQQLALAKETKSVKWYSGFSLQEFEGEVFTNSFRFRTTGRTTLLIQGTITNYGSDQSMVELRFTNTTADKSLRFLSIGLSTLLVLVFSLGSGFYKSSWSFIAVLLFPVLLIAGIGNLSWAIASGSATMRLKELLAAKETV